MLATKEQIQKAYDDAPDYIQDFITSDELDEMFTALRKKYSLHLDDAGQLSIAINTAALGIVTLEQFPDVLKEALSGVPEVKRHEIQKEINEKIFGELREWARLDKEGLLYEEEEEESGEGGVKAEEKVTPTAPASSLEKLDTSVHSSPEKVVAAPPDKNRPYPGFDPYREPPE